MSPHPYVFLCNGKDISHTFNSTLVHKKMTNKNAQGENKSVLGKSFFFTINIFDNGKMGGKNLIDCNKSFSYKLFVAPVLYQIM